MKLSYERIMCSLSGGTKNQNCGGQKKNILDNFLKPKLEKVNHFQQEKKNTLFKSPNKKKNV